MNLPYYPSIIINDQLYRGDIETSAVFEALCASYTWGTQPEVCSENSPPSTNNEINSTDNTLFITLGIIGFVIIVGGILFIFRIILKKETNRDIKVQINNAVSEYFQLSEFPKA